MNGKRTALCLFFLLSASGALLAANPDDDYMPVKYANSENGTVYETQRWFEDSFYDVNEAGWCTEDCRTLLGRKFDHFHFGHGFPFAAGATQVTVAKANYAYDQDYPAYTRVAEATCQYNCHNVALSLIPDPPRTLFVPCIKSHADGIGRYRQDDGYEPISEPTEDCIWSTTTHSYQIVKVNEGCDPNRVTERYEKHDASGDYQIQYSSPGESVTDNLYDN